jgi:hypothetical protein
MLHKLLLSKVPAERIHYKKKVLSSLQNKEGVMIRCSDGTTYHGCVLVGADGAYSAVRQHLYKTLQDQKRLPPSDAKDLSKGYICMVGTTNPLDPEKYPLVKKESSTYSQVIGKGTRFTVTHLFHRNSAISPIYTYEGGWMVNISRLPFVYDPNTITLLRHLSFTVTSGANSTSLSIGSVGWSSTNSLL